MLRNIVTYHRNNIIYSNKFAVKIQNWDTEKIP